MKYAVIKIGNRQFTVKEGEVFQVEKQTEPLDYSVVAYSDGKNLLVSTADLKDIKVGLTISADKRDRKVLVGKFKAKSRYRKMKGHRQDISLVKVSKIGTKDEVAAHQETVTAKVKTEKSEKKPVAKKVTQEKSVSKTNSKTVKKTSKKLAKDEK